MCCFVQTVKGLYVCLVSLILYLGLVAVDSGMQNQRPQSNQQTQARRGVHAVHDLENPAKYKYSVYRKCDLLVTREIYSQIF